MPETHDPAALLAAWADKADWVLTRIGEEVERTRDVNLLRSRIMGLLAEVAPGAPPECCERQLAAVRAPIEAERDRLREALAFARSVILGGESWTDQCERIIGGALAAPPREEEQ